MPEEYMQVPGNEENTEPDIANHPVLEDLYRACDEVEEAIVQLKYAKEQLHEEVRNLPALIGDNEELSDEIVNYLYWFDGRVPKTTLKSAFRVQPPSNASKSGKNVLKSPPFRIICNDCKQPSIVRATSSSNVPYECEQCQAKRKIRDHESSQRYDLEYQQLQQRITELRTMPYSDYLQTPHWQERRKRAMKHAGYRCQVCNAYGVKLNVHHRTYERRGKEQDRDLITLCEGCHIFSTKNGKLAKEED